MTNPDPEALIAIARTGKPVQDLPLCEAHDLIDALADALERERARNARLRNAVGHAYEWIAHCCTYVHSQPGELAFLRKALEENDG